MQAALTNTLIGGGLGGLDAYSMPGHSCFVAGTLVRTENGNVPIEAIQPGDYVWAWDEESGTVGIKQVVETYVNETSELVHVFVGGEEIITTPSHPFYSPVKGWTDAVHLRAGDILVTVNGELVVIEKIQHEILESSITVYNFQVEGYHTYYVSNINVLVHNMCKPQKIYNSIKEAPNYNKNFVKVQNGTRKVNINNKELLNELNQIGTNWKKVYQNGYINGQKVSLHYFQDATGKIFDFKIKYGRWS